MEKDVGIEVFLTKSEGIKGKIKSVAEDFVVEEVSIYPEPSDGKYVVARVISKNWETNRLIERLAKSLGISPNSIKYAGIKDKRAITTQIMSFPVSIEAIKKIDIPNVKIEVLYKSSKPIYSGMLIGNRFHIVIRNIENGNKFEKILEEINKIGGFPNFFGIQRFGIVRPITHLVGKYMLKNEMEKAVMTYIAHPMEGEDEESYKARKFLEETRDFSEALKIYPEKLNFERRVIEYLASHPNEWKNALFKLPRNLIKIFIHAYQSYLFNRILSLRIKKGIPLNEAIKGDVVIPCEKGIVIQSQKGIYVDEKNIDKINRRIKTNKCFPSAAIIGYDSILAKGEMGEIEKSIIEEEEISMEDFKMPHMPEFACKGMRRIVFVPVRNIKWRIEDNNLHLSFFLPKGCYATSLLREFMKAHIYSY